jgi:hypothetical protein
MADSGVIEPKIDSTVSHSARIWNYWLGGKEMMHFCGVARRP